MEPKKHHDIIRLENESLLLREALAITLVVDHIFMLADVRFEEFCDTVLRGGPVTKPTKNLVHQYQCFAKECDPEALANYWRRRSAKPSTAVNTTVKVTKDVTRICNWLRAHNGATEEVATTKASKPAKPFTASATDMPKGGQQYSVGGLVHHSCEGPAMPPVTEYIGAPVATPPTPPAGPDNRVIHDGFKPGADAVWGVIIWVSIFAGGVIVGLSLQL